jgi:ankyrin repeat protein
VPLTAVWDDFGGTTPLHDAAAANSAPLVNFLLQHAPLRADVVDRTGATPLHAAAIAGAVDAAQALLAGGAPVGAADGSGRTARGWAARGGHEAVVALLDAWLDGPQTRSGV